MPEQNFTQLLRAAHGKRLSGKGVDFDFQTCTAVCKLCGHAGEFIAVHLDAFALHAGEHGDQRPVDAFIDTRGLFGAEAWLQTVPKPQRDIRIFCGITRGFCHADLIERQLVLAGAADVFEGDAAMPEMDQRQLIHAVVMLARVEIETHHHRVVDGGNADAIPFQHVQIIFDVMPDFEDGRVLQQPLQLCNRCDYRNLGGGI